jgi:hypothetical protein
VLTPDLYIDGDELVLTIFITPQPGHTTGAPNPETPVRIALPEPIGQRRLVDGSLFDATPDEGLRGSGLNV